MLKTTSSRSLKLRSILILSAGIVVLGCTGSKQTSTGAAEAEAEVIPLRPATLRARNPDERAGIRLEPVEGAFDTVGFHIGAPLFLRLTISGDRGCEPGNGQPFYFDESGAQIGWGFEEVTDSLLFPRSPGSCERIVMLSSENSNRLAEGIFTMNVSLFLDERSKIASNTIVLHPIRSHSGANQVSYARFLQEQIVRRTPLLNDPETLQALFAEGVPTSAEAEVYRAVILFRSGDHAGAELALRSSTELAAERGYPLSIAASIARETLTGRLRSIDQSK